MGRREFTFIEGNSQKFWAIELAGTRHIIRFGRIGTAGQEQTKEFASDAEAKKSHDKLIAEKVKKGYVETTAKSTAGPAPAPAAGKEKPTPKDAPGDGKKSPSAAPTAVVPPVAAAPAVAAPAVVAKPVSFNVAPRFDEPVGPRHWNSYLWEVPQYHPRPAPDPFNLDDCLRRLVVKEHRKEWLWETDRLPVSMTPAEAHFWLEAMFEADESLFFNEKADEPVIAALEKMTFTGKVTPAEFLRRYDARVATGNRYMRNVSHALPFLFTPEELVELSAGPRALNLGNTFYNVVLPFLDEAEREKYRAIVRPRVTPEHWPRDGKDAPDIFYIAKYLEMRDELRQVIRNWPDNADRQGSGVSISMPMVYFIKDDAFIAEQVRRLGVRLYGQEAVRQWVYVTRGAGLDYIKPLILECTGKADATKFIETFGSVKSPEVAGHMIEFVVSSKALKAAKDWLEENLAYSVPGLLPVAAGEGKIADAAVEFLRYLKRHGHEAAIREALKAAPSAAPRITRDVLDYVEKSYEPLDSQSTPNALADALAAAPAAAPAKGKQAASVDVTALPPVLVGERRLNDSQVSALLATLREGRRDAPLLAVLKRHALRKSLDDFVWHLFEAWQGDGAPPKEKWVMTALGLLGSDAIALRLTPLIRQWPGESQHARAVLGLECLRAIGSDTALMCLNGIAQKLKFQGLKTKAKEMMEAIARDKGLSRTELEDRIVPDCDLDERGGRVFDFGPRQFRFVLGPDMKPMVKDADDKLKADLPAPNSRDDATKAKESIEAWKLLKKQVKEVAKIQAERLEQAMVTGRRWSPEQFQTILVRHPLMINLVRLLLWGGYEAGKVVATFRVTEDQANADQEDKPFDVSPLAQVGIVHPMHLDRTTSNAWGQIFGDYEIVPPFEQLGRPVLALEPDEAQAKEITRFADRKLPATALVGTLERLAWVRGVPQDGGVYVEHSKPFPGSNVTAVVQYDGVPAGYMEGWDDQSIERCIFVPGIYTPRIYADHKNALRLADVDPLAVSEVLKDLTLIASKAE